MDLTSILPLLMAMGMGTKKSLDLPTILQMVSAFNGNMGFQSKDKGTPKWHNGGDNITPDFSALVGLINPEMLNILSALNKK